MRYPKLSAYATLFLFVVLGNIFPSPIGARHGQQVPPWINGARNGAGSPCCGKQDCIPVLNTAILEMRGEKVLVVINGKRGEVLSNSLVPSEDASDYVCLGDVIMVNGKERSCVSEGPDGTLNLEVDQECIKCLLISPRS